MSRVQGSTPVTISRLQGVAAAEVCADRVATEEPLEIRVAGRSVAVVMRTPGHDRELAAGFLVTEGVLRRPDQVLDMVYCRAGGEPEENVLDVLRMGIDSAMLGLGKSSIDELSPADLIIPENFHR